MSGSQLREILEAQKAKANQHVLESPGGANSKPQETEGKNSEGRGAFGFKPSRLLATTTPTSAPTAEGASPNPASASPSPGAAPEESQEPQAKAQTQPEEQGVNAQEAQEGVADYGEDWYYSEEYQVWYYWDYGTEQWVLYDEGVEEGGEGEGEGAASASAAVAGAEEEQGAVSSGETKGEHRVAFTTAAQTETETERWFSKDKEGEETKKSTAAIGSAQRNLENNTAAGSEQKEKVDGSMAALVGALDPDCSKDREIAEQLQLEEDLDFEHERLHHEKKTSTPAVPSPSAVGLHGTSGAAGGALLAGSQMTDAGVQAEITPDRDGPSPAPLAASAAPSAHLPIPLESPGGDARDDESAPPSASPATGRRSQKNSQQSPSRMGSGGLRGLFRTKSQRSKSAAGVGDDGGLALLLEELSQHEQGKAAVLQLDVLETRDPDRADYLAKALVALSRGVSASKVASNGKIYNDRTITFAPRAFLLQFTGRQAHQVPVHDINAAKAGVDCPEFTERRHKRGDKAFYQECPPCACAVLETRQRTFPLIFFTQELRDAFVSAVSFLVSCNTIVVRDQPPPPPRPPPTPLASTPTGGSLQATSLQHTPAGTNQ